MLPPELLQFVGLDLVDRELLESTKLGGGPLAAGDREEFLVDAVTDRFEGLALDNGTRVDVHVVREALGRLRVAGHLDHRRQRVARRRPATGGERDDLAAAGDLADDALDVVAGRVHEDETASDGEFLGVVDDPVDRRGPALGDSAEALLLDGRQAALLVPGRRLCAAEVDAHQFRGALPHVDALEEPFTDRLVGTAVREDVFGADELRRLREGRSPAVLDESVARRSDCGVGGDAAGRVGATALHAESEFARVALDALEVPDRVPERPGEFDPSSTAAVVPPASRIERVSTSRPASAISSATSPVVIRSVPRPTTSAAPTFGFVPTPTSVRSICFRAAAGGSLPI